MRFMPDDILKKKMLDTFVDINDVFVVVDDGQKVVDMWRDLDLNTFQVARVTSKKVKKVLDLYSILLVALDVNKRRK